MELIFFMESTFRKVLLCIMCIIVVLLVILPTDWVIFKDILVGIISSVFLLYAVNWIGDMRDSLTYGYLRGRYRRESFSNENPDLKVNTKYVLVPTYVGSEFELVYKGGRKYELPAITYADGIAKATIFLDPTNRFVGSGIYQYVHTSAHADIGHYTIYVDELNPRRLYAFHKNVLPSGIAIGYEVWVKL